MVSTGPFGSVLHKSDYVEEGVPLVNPINIVDDGIVADSSMLVSDATKQRLGKYILKAGDIVVGRRGEIGRCAVVGEGEAGWVCGTGSFFIRPLPSMNPHFLAQIIRSSSCRERLEKASTGTTMKNLSNATLGNLVVPVPPLSEQQRIVGILDDAFDGIARSTANAQQNLRNARALFESHLQSVFTQRGKGWTETTVGAEVNLLSGFPFKSAQYTDSEKDIPLLRGDNIVQGVLRWDDVKRWPVCDMAGYESYQLSAGDVVLAMDRPWVKAGLKRAQISSDDLPCLLVQRTARLRGNSSLNDRFLLYLISSDAFTRHILSVQTGIGVPHISSQQIKDFQFLKPPLEKQLHIVDQLDELSAETKRLESIYQQKLAALGELKKSLLHQAFSGKL